jgi:hypothetical protein
MDLARFRPFLWVLLVLNLIVLLGQLWPAGAPPFARDVNIAFLVLSLVTFALRLPQKKKSAP